MPERRACIFPLPVDYTVDLLNCNGLLPPWEVLSLPVLRGPIPADAKVLDLCNNWECRTIDVRLEHPSFPVWEDGAICPRNNDLFRLEQKAIRLRDLPSASQERERCLKILDFLIHDTESQAARAALTMARRKIAEGA